MMNNMVLHTGAEFLRKYPGKPVDGNDGRNSAMWEAMTKPQRWTSPETAVKDLTMKTTELLNRVGYGWSMLGGALLNTNALIVGADGKEIFAPAFISKWLKLWSDFELEKNCQLLNSNDYPHLTRSEADLRQAVKSLLKMGNKVRSEWPSWAPLLGFGSALTVGASWLLSLSALTIPGAYAERVKDIPASNRECFDNFLKEPQKVDGMLNFIVSEIAALHGIRISAMTSVPTASTFQPLLFSEDEAEAVPVVPKATTPETLFKNAVDQFMTFRIGAAMPTSQTDATFQSLKTQMQESFQAWGAADEKEAKAYDMQPVKQHEKKVKAWLKLHLKPVAAASPVQLPPPVDINIPSNETVEKFMVAAAMLMSLDFPTAKEGFLPSAKRMAEFMSKYNDAQAIMKKAKNEFKQNDRVAFENFDMKAIETHVKQLKMQIAEDASFRAEPEPAAKKART